MSRRLRQMASAAYDETAGYAKEAIDAKTDPDLRRTISSNQVAIVGLIAANQRPQGSDEFRAQRALAHVNWIASRQITIYGQGGRDRALIDATRVVKPPYFLDDVIRGIRAKPISDAALALFQSHELPMLEEIVDGRLTQERFEKTVIQAVESQFTLKFLISHGFGPAIGMFTLLGALSAYHLANPRSESEEP